MRRRAREMKAGGKLSKFSCGLGKLNFGKAGVKKARNATVAGKWLFYE